MASQSLIIKIIRLADGNVSDQLIADKEICDKVFPDGKCIDKSVIPKLLPVFVKFLNSKNTKLQKDCAYLIMAIVCPSNNVDTFDETKLLVETDGIISGLITQLSSPKASVVEQAILSFCNIAYYFPEALVSHGVLRPLIKCLKEFADDEEIIYAGAQFLKNLTSKCNKNIPQIIDAGGIKTLMEFISTSNRNIVEESLQSLINIISCNVTCCQKAADCGVLKQIKNLLSRVSNIRILAVEFIDEFTAYGEEQIDEIIELEFVQIILQQLNNGVNNAEIKVNILFHKPAYFSSHLIQQENIISVLSNNLQNDNELTVVVLSLIDGIIQALGYAEIEQKLKRCGGTTKIKNLQGHGNAKIRRLAGVINRSVENDTPDIRKDVKIEACNKETSNSQGRSQKRKAEQSQVQRTRIKKRRKQSTADTFNSADDKENVSNLPILSSSSVKNVVSVEKRKMLNDEPENKSTLVPFKYYIPSEMFIDSYCEKLGLQFDRPKYAKFTSKIKLAEVCTNSRPATFLPMTDKSGFGCFSVFLIGEEKYAEKIREQIRMKYLKDMDESKVLDKQKLMEISSTTLTYEHLEIISSWWNCKIMVYSNCAWKTFGDWKAEDKTFPVFVMQKEEIGNEIVYKIVSSLKE